MLCDAPDVAWLTRGVEVLDAAGIAHEACLQIAPPEDDDIRALDLSGHCVEGPHISDDGVMGTSVRVHMRRVGDEYPYGQPRC